jgi:hypothetical protein
VEGSVTQDALGSVAAPGRIPIARDVNAYAENRTRDLYYAFLEHRKLLAKHRIRLRFQKPADHRNHCVVFDLGYGVVEVKWSDTYGYYRYFYAYEYSNSGTRKFEKVLLREQLGLSTEEAKDNLLSRLSVGAFSSGHRESQGRPAGRPGAAPRLVAAAAGLAALLGAGGAALFYFLQ